MATEFSTGKSIFILAIVAGCFAILWPNIFYPMLQGSYPAKTTLTTTQGAGCCDVIFDNDVEAIKVMTDLCERILRNNQDTKRFHITNNIVKMNAAIAEACRDAVWEKCRVDITQVFTSKTGLNRSYKQFVEELRSLNSSVCLKQAFGVSFGMIGLPRTIRTWGLNRPKHLRQERPLHLRPEFLHPALREKGRAIPHSHIVPKVDGRPPTPMPGMRPPMGGAGHVVPPPKGSGTMSIVMPMYTIGIVVFFLYTMMKLMFKKSDSGGNYDSFTSDPDFHRTVFGEYNYSSNEEIADDTTKLVVSAITGLVEEVNKQIRSDERLSHTLQETNEATKKESENTNGHNADEKEDKGEEEEEEIEEYIVDKNQDKGGIVKVVGYEMTESSSTGGKYSRPPTPSSRPPTPQSLYLSSPLPPQSQLLVSQEETQTLPSEDSEEPVVLSAKVTLSLIGLPEPESGETKENDTDTLNKSNFNAKNRETNITNNVDKNEAEPFDGDIAQVKDKSTIGENGHDKEDIIDGCIDNNNKLKQETVHVNNSDM